VSHIIIRIKINDNIIEIIMETKINKLRNEEILTLYSIALSLNDGEQRNGNEYGTANMVLSFNDSKENGEFINIFKIMRYPIFYEFVHYFLH
jgi:hypothetical protein